MINKNKKQTSLIIICLFSLSFLGASCSSGSFSLKNSGGVFKTEDKGKEFVQKVKIDEENTISDIDILDIAISVRDSNIVYLGTNGSGVFKSDNGGENWRQLFGDTVARDIEIDPLSSEVVYVSVTSGERGKIFKTSDGGENWDSVYAEAKSGVEILSLKIDRFSSSKIYAGNSAGVVLRSVDFGNTWKVINKSDEPVSNIKISQINPLKIYYATESALFVSNDGGSSFEELEVKIPERKAAVVSFELDPKNDSVIYVGSGRNILKSVDGGVSFSSVNILNPTGPAINGISINPKNSSEWFYGSGFSFYRTFDNGTTWSVTQLNSTRVIKVIEIDPINPDIIYLGMEKIKK